MRDAILLTHRIPFPPNKGDKIRAYHLLRHLARRWRVHLGCFVDCPEDRAHVAELRGLCAQVLAVPIRPGLRSVAALRGLAGRAPLTYAYHHSGILADWVAEVRRAHRPDLEYALSSGVAPYLFRAGARREQQSALRIVDLVDLDSEKWRAYAQQRGLRAMLYAIEARRLAAAEVELTRMADHTLLVSEAEAADLRRRSGAWGERVRVVGNGVDLDYFDPKVHRTHPFPGARGAPALVFTGAMDYRPNVEGILWFADQVWPRLAVARPELHCWIVGARPDPRIVALRARPRVTVTGSVVDVRPWLANAVLAIVPLRMARGVQNKLLEAMAMRLAVVATSTSAVGLDRATQSLLALADEPADFAASVLGLLDDPTARAVAGAAARRRMEEVYGWAARLGELDRLLDDPHGAPDAMPRTVVTPQVSRFSLRPSAQSGRG